MRYSSKKTKNKYSDYEPVLRLFLEAGLLKRIQRSGWWVVGIDNPETVAEHSFRTAFIGFFLARLEKADPYKVLVMTLFNDIHEARINDLHKMGQRYIDFSSAESRVFTEQIKNLPSSLKLELEDMRHEFSHGVSREATVARDADILECLLQAKEYYEQGNRLARNFFKKAPAHLKTKSSKVLWRKIKICAVDGWWQELTEFKR